jgi:hypothetical protein
MAASQPQEREDFAASAAYSEHLQYRQWQVLHAAGNL